MENRRSLEIKECAICYRRVCENSKSKCLEFCEYGVAYFNDDGHIHRKRERVTKHDIAANLRHELNRVLQFIINEAEEIDPHVSVRSVDLKSAASRIVGATVILDQFIEMMCGVHQFNQIQSPSNISDNRSLEAIVTKQLNTYSLISNTRRAKDLNVKVDIPKKIKVNVQSAIIEYLVAIFCDNLWKYSLPDHPVIISLEKGPGVVDLSFSNKGNSIPEAINIFEAGEQLDKRSEGFGYGLAWAQILAYQYNHELGIIDSPEELKIEYSSSELGYGKSIHKFTLKNIVIG